MKEYFSMGTVFDKGLDARALGNSQFDNFFMLTAASARSKKLKKLMMNNVGFGMAVAGLRVA
jgi:hypothetical protein